MRDFKELIDVNSWSELVVYDMRSVNDLLDRFQGRAIKGYDFECSRPDFCNLAIL